MVLLLLGLQSRITEIDEKLQKYMLQTKKIGAGLRAPWQNEPYKNKHKEQHATRKITRRNKHLEKINKSQLVDLFKTAQVYNINRRL